MDDSRIVVVVEGCVHEDVLEEHESQVDFVVLDRNAGVVQ